MSVQQRSRGIPVWLRVVGVLTLAFIVVVVGLAWQFGPYVGFYLIPESPGQRGQTALRFMDWGIYADTQEWKRTRAEAEAFFAGEPSNDAVTAKVKEIVKIAGGKHSFLVTNEVKESSEFNEYIEPEVTVENRIVTLKVPAFNGYGGKGQRFADTLVDGIPTDACGAIVDLRENRGGDMGPMVAGVSPLIPDGNVTQFNAHGTFTNVVLEQGTVTGGGSSITVRRTDKLDIPVAILTSDHTGSSGEQTLLAFRGLPNTRTFGQPTAGYATVNETKLLSDGSILGITVGSTIARTGEEFGDNPIQPDETVALQDAPAIAKDWLASKGCDQ